MSQTILEPLRFPLQQSRLIEASAGTGKTYTIAALYVRLVLNHGGPASFGRPLRPEQILVVTFTEAATAELRDRIRARLSEAAAYFRQLVPDGDESLQALRADYPDPVQWPSLARRLELAAEAMDDAAVHTIHGWCNRMLQEHAFASGSLFTQQLNADTEQLWLDAGRDYWRVFVTPLKAEELRIYTDIQQVLASPQQLGLRAKRLQQQYQQVQPTATADPIRLLHEHYAQLAAWRTQLEQQQGNWHEMIGELRIYCDDLIGQKQRIDGRKFSAKNVYGWLDILQQWADQLNSQPVAILPDLTAAAWWRFTEEGMAEALKEPLQPLPIWGALKQLKAQAESLQLPQAELYNHALGWTIARVEQLQQQRAEMGFDDMLTRLQAALTGSEGEQFAGLIRRQFPVAMIDEFQDTDPIQYTIFNAVYRLSEPHPDTGVFLIGDPKQAIYSFRNADIYTYLQARRDTSGRHYTLAKNYRSTEAMVAASNQLFELAREYPRGAFLFRSGENNPLPFTEVAANGLKRTWQVQGKPAAALQLQWLDDTHCDATEVVQRELLAQQAAEQISQLLMQADTGFAQQDEFTRLAPGDIAILVSNANEASLVRRALQKRQLASVYLSDRDSVFAGYVATELELILQACAEPRQPERVRTALATRLLNFSWGQLAHELEDELAWDQRIDQFSGYHQLWVRQGVLAMLQRILHDFDIPAQLLQTQQGERALTNLLHLGELLQRESAVVEGIHGLLRYVSEHIQNSHEHQQRTDNSEQQIRLESDRELIQVITIHKSKGLQYPLVFLPFVAAARPAKFRIDQVPYVYHDETGQLQFSYDKSGQLEQFSEQERLAEDLRKLYVAVTRAQYATYIGVAPLPSFSQSALHYLLTGETYKQNKKRQVVGEQIRSATPLAQQLVTTPISLTCYQAPISAAPALQVCQLPAQFALKSWWVSSYSALRFAARSADSAAVIPLLESSAESNALEAKYDDTMETERAPQEGTIHAFPKGAQAGTFLHELLEQAAHVGFASLVEQPEQLDELVQRATQLPQWQPYQELLRNWLSDYLKTALALPAGGAALTQLQQYQAEPEFWFAAHEVDAQELDRLVRQHILPGYERPLVEPMQLNGMLKGFIDLTFVWQGQYYVADYKSNYLGADSSAYDIDAMRSKILAARYDLQYVIYTLALHRLLRARLGETYDYDEHVGGAVYLFLRGYQHADAGAFIDRPPRQLIEQLDALFSAGGEHD